jgi:uncharacterized protein YdhG (YjbR/CyaY superfamily)
MTVDEYIATQREEIRPLLMSVRRTIKDALPCAEEKIAWQMPTYRQRVNIIHFAAQKNHLGNYPGADGIEHFAPVFREKGYRFSKGAVQFPYSNVPLDLIFEIALWCGEHRQREQEEASNTALQQKNAETADRKGY